MALRDVNLVPEPILQHRYRLRHGVGWALAAVVTAVVLGAYLACTQGVVAKRRIPMSEEQVRKRLAGTIAEIGAKKEEIERLAFVQQVSSPFGTAEILGRLAEALDPETWLTRVSLGASDGGTNRLDMQGVAFSNARLGTTIRALTADDRFEDVVLKNSTEVRQSAVGSAIPRELVRFSIEAKVLTR